MSANLVSIKCKKCNQDFQPDAKTRGYWICPNCQAKNPNLKRHYRSVADLYILWLIFSGTFLFVHFKSAGLDGNAIFTFSFLVLLVVTIAFISKSKEPWNDKIAKVLIWLVFGISLAYKLLQVAGMLLTNKMNIPFTISFVLVYSAIFIYLLWLHLQASKYAMK